MLVKQLQHSRSGRQGIAGDSGAELHSSSLHMRLVSKHES